MSLTVIGGRTPREFLEEYWQKRPLLVRGGLAGLDLDVSRSELFEMAARDDTGARLVALPEEGSDWTLRTGPFPADELSRLPARGWTVLVQEANRHHEGCARLLEQFRFVPNWRVDDVMVSYATDGGGVGPHVDRYDVFLCQAHGRRRWRIASRPVEEVRYLPGSELPVLETFEYDEEWELEAGDILYLPPGIAHEGVALGECVTCSVGFRAPDPRELSASFLRQLPPEAFEAIRYADPDRQPADGVGEISEDALRKLRESVRGLFDERSFDLWVGRYVTQPRHEPRPATALVLPDELRRRLSAGATLRRSAPPHFAWIRHGVREVRLFVGGEVYRLGGELAGAVELLCGRDELDGTQLGPYLDDPSFAAVIVDLLLRGYLEL